MSFRNSFRPRLDSLEKRTVLSAGASAASAAVIAAAKALEPGPSEPQLSSVGNATALTSTQIQTVELIGHANGTYTSRQANPDTGTQFSLHATGALTPIGSAVVTGSFHTPGFISGGVATGTLTIVGPKGTLHLDLTDSGLSAAGISADQADPVNPGGPMIRGSNGGSGSTFGGPIILVNTFQFRIISGTGQYAHDRGTGKVQIQTTPGLLTPTGPGIYASSLVSTAGVGRTILHFTQA
jgi:hypothetical protein